MIDTPDSNEFQPLISISEVITDANEKLDNKLYKSLTYLSDLQFIEKDIDGLKMRLKKDVYCGDYPFEVGYMITSPYDDRKFLIGKVDPLNGFLWFGLWEE